MAFGPFAAAALTGGLSFLGGKSRNRAASAQAQRQMDFQERMSNTAHQREIADLRKAGLNPILSATGGRGASSPGGAQAPMQDIVTPGISSALASRRLVQEIRNMKANELQAMATATAQVARADLSESQSSAIAPAAGVGQVFNAAFDRLKDLGSALQRPGVGILFENFKQKLSDMLTQGFGVSSADRLRTLTEGRRSSDSPNSLSPLIIRRGRGK